MVGAPRYRRASSRGHAPTARFLRAAWGVLVPLLRASVGGFAALASTDVGTQQFLASLVEAPATVAR